MTVKICTVENGSLCYWSLKHLFLSHGALLFADLKCSLLFMFGLIWSLTASGERPYALPQAAECPDRPGLSQTQTGS